MSMGNPSFQLARPGFSKILVIDEDASTATTIAKLLAKSASEIITCGDMALAEVAVDLTEFDVILVAPSSSGLDGADGLGVLDFLLAKNPGAVAVMMVPQADGDLKAAVERRGLGPVLSKPLSEDEFTAFSQGFGIRLAS
jgi:DNA-binding NtrC family response regulator